MERKIENPTFFEMCPWFYFEPFKIFESLNQVYVQKKPRESFMGCLAGRSLQINLQHKHLVQALALALCDCFLYSGQAEGQTTCTSHPGISAFFRETSEGCSLSLSLSCWSWSRCITRKSSRIRASIREKPAVCFTHDSAVFMYRIKEASVFLLVRCRGQIKDRRNEWKPNFWERCVFF